MFFAYKNITRKPRKYSINHNVILMRYPRSRFKNIFNQCCKQSIRIVIYVYFPCNGIKQHKKISIKHWIYDLICSIVSSYSIRSNKTKIICQRIKRSQNIFLMKFLNKFHATYKFTGIVTPMGIIKIQR